MEASLIIDKKLQDVCFVSVCDASKGGFQPAKEPLDLVAFLVKFCVGIGGELSIGFERDHVDCTLCPDHFSDPTGVRGFSVSTS